MTGREFTAFLLMLFNATRTLSGPPSTRILTRKVRGFGHTARVILRRRKTRCLTYPLQVTFQVPPLETGAASVGVDCIGGTPSTAASGRRSTGTAAASAALVARSPSRT